MHFFIVKNANQTKCKLPPTIPPQTPPPSPPLPHNYEFIGAYFIQISPWMTRHYPGWFKWGFKEYWNVRFSQMTKVCWDSQTLVWRGPVVMHYWNGLFRTYTAAIVLQTLLESEAPQLQKHTRPRSFQIWIWHPKKWHTPTVLGVPSNFCFKSFCQNAPLRLQNPTWPTLDPGSG